MDGLEVKVRLGSVWKQSLTELSGGQRYFPFFWPLSLHYDLLLFVQFSYRIVVNHGPSTIQARPNVHSRRDRRSAGPVPHPTHWPPVPYTIQRRTVHRGVIERWLILQCECVVPYQV